MFGGWTGDVHLVMSSLLNKNQVLLGLDFLKQYKIKEDHGNDTLEIDGVHMQINACKVEHDAANPA